MWQAQFTIGQRVRVLSGGWFGGIEGTVVALETKVGKANGGWINLDHWPEHVEGLPFPVFQDAERRHWVLMWPNWCELIAEAKKPKRKRSAR